MEEKILLTEESNVENYELQIRQAQVDGLNEQINQYKLREELEEEFFEKLCHSLSRHLGQSVTKETLPQLKCSKELLGKALDEATDSTNHLIRPSHGLKEFSLIRKNPELEKDVPNNSSDLTRLLEKINHTSAIRASEIMTEYSSDCTRRAYTGDLVYWQAWLSAIEFSFKEPINSKEIISFIIQHAEGPDPEVDKKLVYQNFKVNLGPHKLSTIKRRVASLSVFLEQAKWPNPCHEKEVRQVLSKLTKKYGGSKPAGKAITKNILDDMLDTCGSSLIDLRDQAVLLFAWGSGGRRRSEVAAADIKDLTEDPDGNYTYVIPKSKTDQEGKGSTVPIKGRVARALKKWITAAKIEEGHIFRTVAKGGNLRGPINGVDVYRIVKRRLKKAGYDESQFGAHSLRSGFVTEAGRKNKPLGDVMALTTHRNVNTVMKYYQAGNIINNSASDLAE